MPIYEYRCGNCHRKSTTFWRSIGSVDESRNRCTHCGSASLTRLVSKVRVIRGGSRADSDAESRGSGDMDAELMKEFGGMDENDPRSLGRMMRKMASESGEEMGPEFNEIIGRLEKGEDPEKIEQSMGDMFGGGEGDAMADDEFGSPPEAPSTETPPAASPAAKTAAKAATRAVRQKRHNQPVKKQSGIKTAKAAKKA
ncbi:MAG TPA: FmdB family zinc ribbon protein [Anaerolineae bacterium]|jgi:putative FmdB family regulatory protein